MNTCLQCGEDTTNPKFCSRSCAATYNNHHSPKRLPTGACRWCGMPIQSKDNYCSPEHKELWEQDNPRHKMSDEESKRRKVDSVVSWRKRTKARAIEYLGGSCIRCGYDTCSDALEFHHRDPSKKDFGIGSHGVTRAWSRVKKELDKCDLLCANCHREVHAGL